MTLTGKNLIGDGESATSGGVIRAVNPANPNAPLEPGFIEATSDEIDRALQLASGAAAAMRGFGGDRLGALCDAIAGRLEAHKEAILGRCGLETAYPQGRRENEFARTVNQMRLFGAVAREGAWLEARIDHGDPAREPAPKPDVRRVMVPVGPVAVFGAGNFPLALSTAGGDTASALAAGCPVVIKAHPSHPGTSELIARACLEAIGQEGFPEGTLSLLHGASHGVGSALVVHPSLAAVGFTGSLAGGRALYELAARRKAPIPVYAEMGSINPQFVLAGKLAAEATALADALFASVTMGNGQFCTNPGLVFVPESEGCETFLARLRSKVEEEGPMAPMLNHGICAAYDDGLDRLAHVPGVELVRGGRPDGVIAGAPAVAKVPLVRFEQTLDVLQEEVFGPSTLVVTCPPDTDFAGVAASLRGQLASSVHGSDDDLARAGALLRELTRVAGRVVVNGFPTGIEVCHAMHHGGPFPATTHSHFTSIGTASIARWGRPVCYQDVPDALLPPALQEANPLSIARLVDGKLVLP